MTLRPALLIAAVAVGVSAADTVADPSHTNAPATASGEPTTVHSWEMPAITVPGEAASPMREDDLIGEYGQPRWTARRRFAETRIYVIPQGQIEFEYWLFVDKAKHGQPQEVKHQYEVEMGLPYRFQVDLYEVLKKDDSTGALVVDQSKFEVRWALADWGKIWSNPTLYLEWENNNNDYDQLESKLLFADDFSPRWHWGLNLVWEQFLGGTQEISHELTGGVAYGLIDQKLSVGAEVKMAWIDDNTDRGNYTREFTAGPSIQVRPLPQMHIDLAFLLGFSDQAVANRTVLIAGWEF